jgi:lactate racemase
MIYKLAYGKTGLFIELPDNYNVDFIEPKWTESVHDQHMAISEALRNPCNSKPLKEIVTGNDKVGIVFSDITRATPYHIIIPQILNELRNIPKKLF